MITSSLFDRKLSIIESFLVVWNTSILMNVLSAVAIIDLLLKDIVRQEDNLLRQLLQLVVFTIHGHRLVEFLSISRFPRETVVSSFVY